MVKSRSGAFGDACRILAVGVLLPAMAFAAGGRKSESAFVFLQPETSSFWRTVTNSTVTIPVYFPKNATKANFLVEGMEVR